MFHLLNPKNTPTQYIKSNGLRRKLKWTSFRFPLMEEFLTGLLWKTSLNVKRYTSWNWFLRSNKTRHLRFRMFPWPMPLALTSPLLINSSSWLERRKETSISAVPHFQEIIKRLSRDITWQYTELCLISLTQRPLYQHQRIGI